MIAPLAWLRRSICTSESSDALTYSLVSQDAQPQQRLAQAAAGAITLVVCSMTASMRP